MTEATEPTAVAPEMIQADQTPPVDPPPEVPQDPPEDPDVLGVMEPAELGMLTAIQQQGRAIVQRIGEAEVEKARLLGQLSNLEAQNQQHLQNVAKRLGIPQGTQWQVTNDGKVRGMTQAPRSFQPRVVPKQG